MKINRFKNNKKEKNKKIKYHMGALGVEPLTLGSWGQPPYQLSQALLVTKACFNEINNKTTTKIKHTCDLGNQRETTKVFKFKRVKVTSSSTFKHPNTIFRTCVFRGSQTCNHPPHTSSFSSPHS